MAQIHKNIGFAGLGQFIYTVLAFALIPFASRYLGEAGFGIYSLAASVGFAVSLVTDLGMATLLTREVSKMRRLATPLFAYYLGIKSVLVFLAIGLLLFYFRVGNLDNIAIHSILIFSISSILNSYTQNSFSIFRAFEKMQYETVGVALEKFLSVLLGIVFLVMGFEIRIFLLSFLIASIIKLIVSFVMLSKKFIQVKLKFSYKRSVPLVTFAVPFGISVMLAVCYNYQDIIMLSAMTNFKDVGLYSGSYKFLNMATLVPTVLTTAFLPQFSMVFKDNKKLTELFIKGVQFLFIITIPMVPVVIITSHWLVFTFLGSKFDGSIISLNILVFAAFAQMLNTFFVALYASVNKQKKILQYQLVGLFINLVMNLVLIPIISYRGAAIATIATEWSILVFVIWWARVNIFTKTPEWKQLGFFILKLLLATVSTCSVLLAARYFNINELASIFTAMIVYLVLLQLLKCVNFGPIFIKTARMVNAKYKQAI